MALVPKLPQELLDTVIAQLYDNSTTLLRCSRVCRSWTHSARTHLIHNISFDCKDFSTKRKIKSLHLCLSSDQPLAGYIHSLSLFHLQWTASVFTPGDYEELARILVRVSRVHSLFLDDVRWRHLQLDVRHALVAVLGSPFLSILHLKNFSAEEPSVFAGLLSNPPNLKILYLENTKCDENWRWDQPPEVPEFEHPQLAISKAPMERLEITSPFSFWALHSLFHLKGSLCLTELSHLCISKTNRPLAVGRLLQLVGNNLEFLEINVVRKDKFTWQDEQMCIHLTDLPRLRCIKFSEGVTELAIKELFKDIREEHPLENIIVRLSNYDFRISGWSEVYYLQRGLKHLKRVEYLLPASYLQTYGRQKFFSSFQNLRKQGLLRVSRDDSD